MSQTLKATTSTIISRSTMNTAIGRRAFLKRSGAATVATAAALQGFRVQSRATTSQNIVNVVIADEEIREGVFRCFVMAQNIPNPPTAADLAAAIAAGNRRIKMFRMPLEGTSIARKTTYQAYINPLPNQTIVFKEVANTTAANLADIRYLAEPDPTKSEVYFEATSRYRNVVEFTYFGTPVGSPWSVINPTPYPSFP